MPVSRTLLEQLLHRLYRYALVLTGERESARDLTQDCALHALRAGSAPEDAAACRAWLFRILRNLHIDKVRRARTVGVEPRGEVPEDTPEVDVWQADESLVNALTVRLALERLPKDKREVIALVDLAGCSYAEAAAILDIPRGTVMSRLSRARKALLAAIQQDNVRQLPLARRAGGAGGGRAGGRG